MVSLSEDPVLKGWPKRHDSAVCMLPSQCWESVFFPSTNCVKFSSFPYKIMVCVYVFPLSMIENQTAPLFWDCVMLPSFSLWVWGCCLPPGFWLLLDCWGCNVFWDCCWVVLATLGPRTTLKRCLTCTVFRLFVWGCHPVVFTFFTELWTVVVLWHAVVGIWTVESRIRGWVCLRKLVFEVTSLAFILS